MSATQPTDLEASGTHVYGTVNGGGPGNRVLVAVAYPPYCQESCDFAHLIASAPRLKQERDELAEALRELLAAYGAIEGWPSSEETEMLSKAAAALAKLETEVQP